MISPERRAPAVDTSYLAPVQSDRDALTPSPLTITRVNPLEHADEIKQLFVAHGRPEFPEFFDRAYHDAVAAGATSWIGRDEHGHLRSHIALFPRQFHFAGRTVRGSLLANLMVATSHRTFWPAHALLRRAVRDAKASRSMDFLYADPNEAARAIAHAAGLRSVAELRRFVLPLSDRRRGVGLSIQLYQLIHRLRARPMPLTVTEWGSQEPPDLEDRGPEAEEARSLRPIRGTALYRSRLAAYPSPSDCWYSVHSQDGRVAKALVRRLDGRHAHAVVCALQYQTTTHLNVVLTSLARHVRQTGGERLEVWALAESRAASAARLAGFLPRHDRIPLLALAFTEVGAEVVAAGADWRLLLIDLDR